MTILYTILVFASRFRFYLGFLPSRKLQVSLSTGYLKELDVTFSWKMKKRVNLPCFDAWWKIPVIVISCMPMHSMPSPPICHKLLVHLTMSGNLFSLNMFFLYCRSALRAFKRRVVYSNVGHDRILSRLLLVVSYLSCAVTFLFLY